MLGECLRLFDGHAEEVRSRGQRLEAELAQLDGEALPLLDLRGHVGRRGKRGEGERGRGVRDRRRRLPAVQLERGVHVGERVADARAREAERLRERPQDDNPVVDEPGRGLAARILEIGLVDDERPRLGKRNQLAGRVVGPAAEREHRRGGADRRAGDPDGGSVERVRLVGHDRDLVAGARERPRAEQDQVVGAGAEHDVLRLDARIPRDRRDQLREAAVRVRVDIGERRRDRGRTRGWVRPRRHVAVEADDLERIEPRSPCELGGRRRPLVLGELRGQRLHRRTARACAGSPSAAASASTTGHRRANPSSVSRCTVTGLRNVSSPSPPTERAQPPVGRT